MYCRYANTDKYLSMKRIYNTGLFNLFQFINRTYGILILCLHDINLRDKHLQIVRKNKFNDLFLTKRKQKTSKNDKNYQDKENINWKYKTHTTFVQQIT